MHAEVFVDTNVFLYAASTNPEEAAKRTRARQVLARRDWSLSVQVLQELYVNLVRTTGTVMSHDDAVALILQLSRRPLAVTDRQLVLEALRLKQRFQLSYWDAAIIAAAKALGASTLLSEDLNHGQDYEGVCVQDPFRAQMP